MSEDTKESLKAALSRISKIHEEVVGQIKTIGEQDIQVMPSGSFSIDHALGVNGIPRSRILEIFGAPSGGKTTISLLMIAAVQKAGGTAAFIDVEHSLSLEWARKLGVNTDDLVFCQPTKGGEQALSITEDLVKTGQLDILVIDSVAGLTPRSELEGEMGDQQMAAMARMMGQAMRKLVPVVGQSKAALIFINQVREGLNPYGEKEVTPGGKALKFFSSIRMSVKKMSGSDIKGDQGEILGHRVEVQIRKNKVAPPSTRAEFTLKFLEGVDRIDELVTLGLTLGLIEQAGPTYRFGEVTAKGREKFMEIVNGDVKIQEAIWNKIKEFKK